MFLRAALIAAAIATATFVAGTAMPLAAPAVAHSAPVGDFLNQVTADGITSSSSPDDLVTVARGVCDMLNTENGAQASQFVYQQTGLDQGKSIVLVADAIHYFCPWQDQTGGQMWQATHPGGQALS
jgi:Protein of unknown function (DUF732)